MFGECTVTLYLFISLTTSGQVHSHPLQHPGQDCWSRHWILCVNSQCPTNHLDHYTFILSNSLFFHLSLSFQTCWRSPEWSIRTQERGVSTSSTSCWLELHRSSLVCSAALQDLCLFIVSLSLILSHPTQIHCCWTVRWRATRSCNMEWTLWKE